ncbi:MAG: autoinducer synthase [Rhodobacterales bacterium]|jgi:N-acyl-L-homoserine lactone synthetase|nr:autoinducer synthase [Rhodobacterales bacterium]
MENITFNMSSLHLHGPAFYDFLRLRKRFFVDSLGWDIPHDDRVEMDQYDNPLAHYSLVLLNGEVVGGARTMATTATWGQHTYMLRDAVGGRLADIPADILGREVADPCVWECTRLVIADEVKSHADRSLCLSLIVDGLVDVAARHGAEQMISLSPLPLMRALRQLGFGAERIGAPYRNDTDGRQYAVLAMPAVASMRAWPQTPRATHLAQPMALHAPAVA